MARKPNQIQLERFLAGLPIATRSHIASGVAVGNNLSRNEKAILNSLESARHNSVERVIQQAASIHTATTAEERLTTTIASMYPATLEDSGLYDPAMILDDSQEAAVKVLLEEQYVALIGAAGTGKTTLLKRALGKIIYGDEGVEPLGVRKLDGDQGLSIAICAFTGNACSVIQSTLPKWLHPAVKTIHSMLEYKPSFDNPGAFYPTRGVDNKMDYDIIIIDETSMLGLNLWHNIVDALQPHTKIIVMGDINQLIPIADSPFFAYLLAHTQESNSDWKLVELKKVHRQKGIGGQRILDSAHAILRGEVPTFDEFKPNQPWYVGHIPVSSKSEEAHAQIIKTLSMMRNMYAVDENGNKTDEVLYDPLRDVILTTGNGDDPNQKGAAIQQSPINRSLARILIPDSPDTPVFVIDAGLKELEYAVGDRVVCRVNEPPGTVDRVTNGSVGFVTHIEPNSMWNGDRNRFGSREKIREYQLEKMANLMDPSRHLQQEQQALMSAMESMSGEFKPLTDEAEKEKQASHIVHITYKNGAKRIYSTASKLAGTQLAYAVTTTTAQGSQARTVVIICHSAAAFQLNREWFYTSMTRATDRVLVFGTDLGLRTAVSKQQITGRTIQEKIQRFAQLARKGVKIVRYIAD